MDKIEEAICDFYDSMKFKTLEKYRKGRDEHKDDLTFLDCKKEFADELKDIICYFLIDKNQ